jgi:ribulose-phosphate 3-epimerase
MNAVKLAPSILSADFARLGDQVREAERAGADRIHVDVMDGHFVPNLSMGPVVVKSLRPVTRLPLETHLMVEEPDRYVEAFARAGSDTLIIHVESKGDLRQTLRHVKQLGKKVGVTLRPPTPVTAIEAVLPEVDLVLVMTVNPGFGGQAFMHDMLPKVRRVHELIAQINPAIELEVDGGIDVDTTPLVVAEGARVLVAGSAIYGAKDGVKAAMDRLSKASGGA